MVPVGLPNNLGDQTSKNRGSVAYSFQMGTYEVSNTEYAAFLNAVAKNDAFYRLYSTYMGTDANGGIMRSGSNGSFVYTVKAGFENKPVNFVSVYSAMRFCNWLHNGAQPNGDTEEGAYRLLGNATANIASVQRNTSARYFLPSVDEWHKAAFYDPSPAALPSASYWIYATKSQVPNASQINYAGANYGSLTPVGTPGVASYFGTYGQSGNAAEWTEDIYQDPVTHVIYRVVAGGNWASASNGVSSQGYVNTLPTTTVATGGFRVASITGMPLGLKSNPIVGVFSIPAKVYGSAAYTLTPPTSTSSGAWSYSSGNTNVATVSGNTVTIKGAGTAVITASQASSGNYNAASTTANLVVNGVSPTLGAFSIPAKVYGAAAFSLTAPTSTSAGSWSYSSGNTNVATVSSNTVTIKGAGTAVITATQVATPNYLGSSTNANLVVTKASQTITFTLPATNTFTSNGLIPLAGKASSGLGITYTSAKTNILTISGTNAVIKGRGTNMVTASQSGNGNYNAATNVVRTIVIK
jgi:formylglycine-generating enzyme required for sulfatase activity